MHGKMSNIVPETVNQKGLVVVRSCGVFINNNNNKKFSDECITVLQLLYDKHRCSSRPHSLVRAFHEERAILTVPFLR